MWIQPRGHCYAIVISVVMFACMIWICTRRLQSAMVVAGSCSLVIAAVCHPKYDPNLHEDVQKLLPEEDMEFLPVKWGLCLCLVIYCIARLLLMRSICLSLVRCTDDPVLVPKTSIL
ncbi:hypothetical protein BJX62DRAFT_117869 [Aspergillus germanicus]